MKGAHTVKRLIGWLLVLIGAVVLAGATADSRVGGWLRAPNPPAVTAALAGVDRVAIVADRVEIQVAAGDRPDVTVTVQGSHSGWVKPKLIRQGSELRVVVRAPWWHRSYNRQPIYAEVRLPESYAETVAVEVGEGILAVSGPSADRPFHLKSLDLTVRTARVEIRHLRLGKLAYGGQTGAFSAERVQAGAADLRLVTGKIGLAHFSGALQARLTTGLLEAQFDALTGGVRADLVSGKVVLELPAEAGWKLDASVGRGFIRSDLLPAGKPGPGPATLRTSRGAGTYPVDLRVGNGQIDLR